MLLALTLGGQGKGKKSSIYVTRSLEFVSVKVSACFLEAGGKITPHKDLDRAVGIFDCSSEAGYYFPD